MNIRKGYIAAVVLSVGAAVQSAPLCESIEKFSDALRSAAPPSSWHFSHYKSERGKYKIYFPPGSLLPDGIDERDRCELTIWEEDDQRDFKCTYRLGDELSNADINERLRGFTAAIRNCAFLYAKKHNFNQRGPARVELDDSIYLRYSARGGWGTRRWIILNIDLRRPSRD